MTTYKDSLWINHVLEDKRANKKLPQNLDLWQLFALFLLRLSCEFRERALFHVQRDFGDLTETA